MKHLENGIRYNMVEMYQKDEIYMITLKRSLVNVKMVGEIFQLFMRQTMKWTKYVMFKFIG